MKMFTPWGWRCVWVIVMAGLSLSIFLVTTWTPPCLAADPNQSFLLDRALQAMAMDRRDLRIRGDLSTDPSALDRFRRWMGAPLKAPPEAQVQCRRL